MPQLEQRNSGLHWSEQWDQYGQVVSANGVFDIPVKVQRLDPRASLPEYAHDTDSCFDIFALDWTNVAPRGRARVRTGIALQAPEGFEFQFEDKSGLANGFGIFILGGVIDETYTGELQVLVANIDDNEYVFGPGEKVCQVRIQRRMKAVFAEVKALAVRERGANGFGSTGRRGKGKTQ